MLLNLQYLLFCIPMIVWCGLHLAQMENVLNNAASDQIKSLLGTANMMVLGMIPCLWLTGLANAGIARVCRSWARDEPAFIWQDFLLGIKRNWKQALLTGIISSLRLLVVYWYTAFLATNPAYMSASILPMIICAFVLALWSMILPTVYVMMVTYELKLMDVLKNSVIMTLAHLPTAIGIALAKILPVLAGILIVLYVSAPAGSLLLTGYFLTWGFSLPWLLGSSFANRLCEEFINPKLGAPVRIGLRPSEKE